MDYKCDHKGFNRKEIVDNIEKYGCHVIMVSGDHLPGSVYSIGLYEKFGHPEIICFGMDLNMMASLTNEVCEWIKESNTIEPYIPYDDYLENADVKFIPVDKVFYDDYLNFGINYYEGTNFPVLQMVWPDKENKFPWDEGFYQPWKFQQPLLDRDIDFKFYEERNLGVYTTKEVVKGDPILYVYHDNDGDWQFHTTDDPDFNDAIIVSLKEIIKLDSSLNELYDLKPGWSAFRANKNDKWKRLKGEE